MGEGETNFYPSKIKKIAIELQDYLFFHSPYQPGNPDQRFVGRAQPIRQLRTMLMQTKSISGTYLVTGSRGSGKTSFVNIVLAEIGEPGHLTGRGWQILRIWLALLLAGLIYDYLAPMPLIYGAPVLLLMVAWRVVSRWYNRLPDEKQSEKNGFVKLRKNRRPARQTVRHLFRVSLGNLIKKRRLTRQSGRRLFRISLILLKIKWRDVRRTMRTLFLISADGHLGQTLLNLVQGIFFISLLFIFIILLSLVGNFIRQNEPFYYISSPQFHFLSTVCIFCYWFFLKFFEVHATHPKHSQSPPVRERGGIKKIFTGFFEWLWRRLQSLFKPRLVIRLNLNYSNLNEREVLQLIAHTLYERYNKWRRTPFQLVLRGAQFFFLWLLVAIPYQTINKSGTSLYYLKLSLNRHFNQLLRGDDDSVPEKVNSVPGKSPAFLPALIYQDLNMIYQNSRTFVRNYARFALDLIPFFPKPLLVHWSYYIFPQNFEIILLFISAIFILLVRTGLNRQWIFVPGHSRVLFLLRDLNDRVAAAVTVGSGNETNLPRGIGKVFRNRSLSYPLADERTIEQGILRVLEEINFFPIILGRPVFYFVFDELDKIALPEEPPQATRTAPQFVSSFENMRRRQQQIEKVLSNLKQLLTTAPAKFIFIAGRELYDTCLADFTGRMFLHSSIFNQTFYIDSFLSDHSDPDDHRPISLTESYICQFLLPRNAPKGRKEWPKLTDYAGYLETHFKLNRRLKQKTLRLLEDFIFFCTYRGSGSPKKMTQLMEGYIQSLPEKINSEEWIIIGENPKNRYLVFNFPQQFEICHTARLLQPISQTLEHVSERLNDKLTTSILMVLDYLFKFHKSAFRLDCLEWMPEMLYIHRDPDLRHLIYDILQLIENKYLEPVHNGLFDFRFSNRIRGEISFSSRTSTLESAVFNFSLDESREAERFMLRQLWEQLELVRLNADPTGEQPNLTTGRLYEKLGDLHAFNENYDQALTEYFNTLRLLKMKKNTGETPNG
jgi:hypothetical protein